MVLVGGLFVGVVFVVGVFVVLVVGVFLGFFVFLLFIDVFL